jgi:hypothetical protein
MLALGLVLVAGIALVAACLASAAEASEPGRLAWLPGAGWLVGVLALTVLMRAEAAVGVPFGPASIGLPMLALAVVAAALARRRVAPMSHWRGSLALPGDVGTGAARLAWVGLLAWIVLRIALLAVEVALRPLYAWDAWSNWATKAKTFFAMRTIVPFVDTAGWTTSTTPVWFDAAPWQPVTLPLVQAWMATAAGVWDDASSALPWVAFFVSIALVVYGEVRQRAAPPLHALVAAWLAASLPLLDTQVALAGYADLPLAAAFTLGVLAEAHYFRGRAAWHLLPHRVWWEPARDVAPAPGMLRPGDYVLVWRRPGAQFDAARGSVRFDNGVEVAATALLVERGSALFAVH